MALKSKSGEHENSILQSLREHHKDAIDMLKMHGGERVDRLEKELVHLAAARDELTLNLSNEQCISFERSTLKEKIANIESTMTTLMKSTRMISELEAAWAKRSEEAVAAAQYRDSMHFVSVVTEILSL